MIIVGNYHAYFYLCFVSDHSSISLNFNFFDDLFNLMNGLLKCRCGFKYFTYTKCLVLKIFLGGNFLPFFFFSFL